jgi:hypothetical protein
VDLSYVSINKRSVYGVVGKDRFGVGGVVNKIEKMLIINKMLYCMMNNGVVIKGSEKIIN